MKELNQYKCSLIDTPAQDMMNIFKYKLESSPEVLVDYCGLSIEQLDDRIERLKNAKKDIDMLIKSSNGQKEIIKSELAKLLSVNGVEKLTGDRISSITTYQPAPKKKLIVKDKDALMDMAYVKIALDETAVKKAIENGDISEEVAILEVTYDELTIKLNKKKGI